MTTQQLILSLVLATMVFSVALELRVADFARVVETPRAVICGLIPQFVLLPGATWLATLALDLPANIEAAMILVAATLEAAFALCLGCSMFAVLMRYGVIPEETCVACNNVSGRLEGMSSRAL